MLTDYSVNYTQLATTHTVSSIDASNVYYGDENLDRVEKCNAITIITGHH